MATQWKVDGKPMENYAKALMAEMAQYMSVDDESVGIRMGQYEFFADALFGLVQHKYTVDDETLFGNLEAALRERFKADKLSDANLLLKEFDQRCGKLFASRASFVLVTSISLRDGVPKPRIVNGCHIKFHAKVPRKYKSVRASVLAGANPLNVHEENEGYLFVEVRVDAINAPTAFMVASEALAVYRALCQLQLSKSIRMFAGPGLTTDYPSEIALKLGNIHSMHLPDGSDAKKHWCEEVRNLSKPAKFNQLELLDEKVGKMLSKLDRAPQKYRAFCIRILLAFSEALGTQDSEARFVKLWLCLELLTGADDADNIIRRVAFFYVDQDIATAQLRALRGARNSHVHAGARPGRLSLKNFQLSTFVEHLLLFVISNHFKFDNPLQWHEFMSTTTDAKSIDQQIARLKMVKKFATPSSVEPQAD